MATGIEIAGLVLGSIPIVISALEQWLRGAESIERMQNYRSEAEILKRELLAEEAIFRDICERLMVGIVASKDIDRMVQIARSEAWLKEQIEEKLKIRLGKSYEIFFTCAEDMDRTLQEVCGKLKQKANKKPINTENIHAPFSDWNFLQYLLKHKRYERISQRLRDQNTRLLNLITMNIELEPLRRQKASRVNHMETLRENASVLYSILTTCWPCNCPEEHEARLILQPDAERRVLSEKRQEIVELHSKDLLFSVYRETGDSIRWSYMQLAARLLDPDRTSCRSGTTVTIETQAATPASGDNVSNEMKGRHFSLPFKLKLPFDELSFTKKKKNKRISADESFKTSSLAEVNIVGSERNPTTVTSLAEESQNDRDSEIQNLCSTLQKDFASRTNFDKSSTRILLENASQYGPLLGYIKCSHSQKVAMYPIRRPLSDCKQPIALTLYEILTNNCERVNTNFRDETEMANHSSLNDTVSTFRRRVLTLPNRYLVAMTLASSVLKIYDTPWLRSYWNAKDIVVSEQLAKDENVCISIPQVFPSSPVDERNTTSTKFTPLRNSTIFALGVILIELSLGCSLDSLRTHEDPLDQFGRPDIITNWSTASRACNLVLEKSGRRYWEAVRRCIWCDFDRNITSLDDEHFRSAFVEGVVDPITKVFEDFQL